MSCTMPLHLTEIKAEILKSEFELQINKDSVSAVVS